MTGRRFYYNNIKTDYIVYHDGKVYSEVSERFLKPYLNSNGYLRYNLRVNGKKIRLYAHQLVAQTYISNPHNKPTVNHDNGEKLDNHIDNLSWMTYTEQNIHAVETKLNNVPSGNDSKFTIYPDELIHKVCEYMSSGLDNKTISHMTGVSMNVLYRIRNGTRRKNISVQYDIK